MKKTLFALVLAVLTVQAFATGITERYDEIQDKTFTEHSYLDAYSPAGLQFPNLKDGLVYSAHLRMYVTNKETFLLEAYYKADSWLFTKGILFLSDSGERMTLNPIDRRDQATGVCLERTICNPSDEELLKLKDMLNSGKVYVAYIGETSHTDKMEIKKNLKKAIIEMIDKYFSYKEEK